jgi:UDP-N-acetylglucosamine--N-acetylmuramyl-(pentapeptide) pyrophosphoryl-undecaprenol N-acetylglucosamine transferase
MGGSLGAQALNETVPQALALIPETERPVVTHQAGTRHLAAVEENYHRAGVAATAVAFINDMAAQYAAASQTIAAFSSSRPGDAFPRGWKPAGVPKFRKLTRYKLVEDTGTTVVHAVADSSSSGLAYDVNIDPDKLSAVKWRWKKMSTNQRIAKSSKNTRNSCPTTQPKPCFSIHCA